MEEQFVPKPNSNLILAIFTTICCCLPLGIIAIIKAASVDGLYNTKQYEAAQAAADDAKKWSVYGIIAGAVISIFWLLLNGAAFLAAFAA
ncbi:MAG: CD225/dispanin family protein [Bacteroidaceae bacterium]|nr:CD225/dispanin family protein [Bacteroidaceae bacterium]